MSTMKAKTAKFHPEDIETLEKMSSDAGCTVSQCINECVGHIAVKLGYTWRGKQADWGDPRRFERAEIAARGFPPLADDDQL